MKVENINSIIEALLFASPDPLTQSKVNSIFPSTKPDLSEIILKLNMVYKKNKNAFEIRSVSNGYQLVAKKQFDEYIRLMFSKSGKINLSPAALDSLSIIAYRQPLSRIDIEAIRGVDSSSVIKTLLNLQLISIKGRSTGPGRELLYKTTDLVMQFFGLKNSSDLPKLREIAELIDADPHLGEQIAVFDQKKDQIN